MRDAEFENKFMQAAMNGDEWVLHCSFLAGVVAGTCNMITISREVCDITHEFVDTSVLRCACGDNVSV